MSLRKIVLICALSFSISSCASIAGRTNMLTDKEILSSTSAALGYSPSQLTIISKRVDGTNTYVNLKAKDKKEFHCIINGGNILTFGIVNPPMCAKKGEPINTTPLRH